MQTELSTTPERPPSGVRLLVVAVTDPPLPLSGPPAKVDRLLDGLVAQAIADEELSGGGGELALFHATGEAAKQLAGRIAVVGVGDGEEREPWRKAGAEVAATARRLRVGDVGLWLGAAAGPVEIGAFIDGAGAGGYRFERFKSDDPDKPRAPEIRLVIAAPRLASADVDQSLRTAMAVARARDLSNTPANHLTPTDLAEYAQSRAAEIPGLECEVIEPEALAELGAGAFLSVAAGSDQPARLIVLRYEPPAVGRPDEVLGIVGKAVTFDSGGISIKPASGMEEMKMDMGGGAAAIEGTALIAELGLPVRLLTVVPATENMVSGRATKPGDVVTALNGKTIEVINTDAEGRLILADALTYAVAQGATRLIDLATLTGAIIFALGHVYAGLLGSDDDWTQEVRGAGEISGDLTWPLPMHERYRPLIESKVADLANASNKREAGPIYAAMFLREFTDGRPWCHVDIAGTGMVDGAGTGFGVRLLLALAQGLALAE